MISQNNSNLVQTKEEPKEIADDLLQYIVPNTMRSKSAQHRQSLVDPKFGELYKNIMMENMFKERL